MRQNDHDRAGNDPDEHERSPWRRRLPALVMITILAGAALGVWGDLLRDEANAAGVVSCPRAPTRTLSPVPYRELSEVAPLPPSSVAVRVRNSTSTRGLAARVTAHLELLGFAKVAPPENDPVYPTGTLRCRAQIRFGSDGFTAARTVSLVAPCAELIRDDRADATVDLVLGTTFTSLSPSHQARQALRALAEPKDLTGGLQAVSGTPRTAPLPALAVARPRRC